MINPKQICKAKPEHVEFYTLSITNADINRIPIPENDSTKFSSSFVEMFSFVIIFFLLEVVPYSSLSRIKPAKDGVLALFEERKSFCFFTSGVASNKCSIKALNTSSDIFF